MVVARGRPIEDPFRIPGIRDLLLALAFALVMALTVFGWLTFWLMLATGVLGMEGSFWLLSPFERALIVTGSVAMFFFTLFIAIKRPR